MADSPRIQELRRRILQDPASLAFAPLAEEYRRAGRLSDAIATCRAGLAIHPEYVSARGTLGRALLESGALDEAFVELSAVLGAAPEHLGALRGVADIHHRRGELQAALGRYRVALALVRDNPELQRLVACVEQEMRTAAAPAQGPVVSAGDAEAVAAEVAIARLERFLAIILADRARRGA